MKTKLFFLISICLISNSYAAEMKKDTTKEFTVEGEIVFMEAPFAPIGGRFYIKTDEREYFHTMGWKYPETIKKGTKYKFTLKIRRVGFVGHSIPVDIIKFEEVKSDYCNIL